MNQVITAAEMINLDLVAAENIEFTFVDDADCEFVGGGNAATCY